MTLDLRALAAAKLWLISEPTAFAIQSTTVTTSAGGESPRGLPYLAHALYALIPVESDEVPRITCDEWWRIYVNPRWLAAAPVPEIGSELAHMTWHLLADHTARARDQGVDRSTAPAWCSAADLTVAHTLEPDQLRPQGLVTARDLHLLPGLSAEEYFARLSRLPAGDAQGGALPHDGGCGSGADGVARRHERSPDSDLGTVTSFDAHEIRRIAAIEYRASARARGTEAGDALRWVQQTLEPRVPWEPLLAGAVRRAVGWAAGRGDYTYTRRSRRAASLPGIVLPGQRRPVPRLAIVVDTSASVDDRLLARALGEVDGAIAALGVPGSSVTVYSVDAAVHAVTRVRRATDARLVGAGGTDLRLGLEAVAAERPRPDVVIVFTDGDTPWPAGPSQSCAVVAAILGRDRESLPPTPLWVTRVECLLDFDD